MFFLYSIILSTGVLTGLSAPGINISWLVWIGFVPLLLVLHSKQSVKHGFFLGILFGLGYYLTGCSWIISLHPLTWLGYTIPESQFLSLVIYFGACFHQALHVGLFSMVCSWIYQKKIPSPWSILLIPLAWVSIFNITTTYGVSGLPWLMIEYTQYKNLALIQIADVIGGIGIAFIIIMVNTLVVSLLTDRLPFKRRVHHRISIKMTFLILILLFASLYTYGFYQLSNDKKRKLSSNLSISLIQTNRQLKTMGHQKLSLGDYLKNCFQLLKQANHDLIIFPEGTFPDVLTLSPEYDRLQRYASQQHKDILIGTLGNLSDGLTNAALLITDHPQRHDIYHKKRLMIFGEYMPFQEYLPSFLEKMIKNASAQNFTPGKISLPLRTRKGIIAVSICSEMIHPSIFLEGFKKGGIAGVNIANLAWFHNHPLIGEQFIAAGVFRAIESRRYIVIAANTGPSAIISYSGRLVLQEDVGKESIVNAMIKGNHERTVFSQWYFVK